MDVLLLSGLASAVVALALLDTLIPQADGEAIRVEDEEAESKYRRGSPRD